MLAPFESSQIKIDRAKRHLQELTAEISSFFERGAISVVIEQASEYASVPNDMWAFTYRKAEDVPPTWSAIIGDVLHNLRTSLDLIVSDVHRITGGKAKDRTHVHYPFCRTKSDLPEMIRSRRLSGIGRDFYDAIEKTAPYKEGNEGLRAGFGPFGQASSPCANDSYRIVALARANPRRTAKLHHKCCQGRAAPNSFPPSILPIAVGV
jgi:hypothetical protein